jgi:hypothetical protein
MDKDEGSPPTSEEETPQEEPPPFRPDPELITFLERRANPEAVKVRDPDTEG